MTKHAPARNVAHNNRRISGAGGTVSDSAAGTREAKRQRKGWIDNNGHLMHRTFRGKHRDGKRDTDVVWVNAHGSPFNPRWLKGKLEDHVWRSVHLRHPRLRSARRTFTQNAKAKIKTEWEVKDLHPLVSDAVLDEAFERLAADARAAYGEGWRGSVVVKVLTNLRGGLEYAKTICRHAHEAGFKTMILPRGGHVHQVINEPYITWNRGGRV